MKLFNSPAKLLAWFTAVTSAFWVIQTSLCQKILPLDVIEAIVWGEQMQWGYTKSPPLSGYIAYGFSLLSGHQDWSLYLAAQLCVVCAVFFVYKLAREFFDESRAALSAMLLYFLYYYMPPAMKFCSHDTQIAFLPAMGYFFYKGLKEDRWKEWLCFAFFSALAMLGKYSAGQQLLGCFAVMLFTKAFRKRFLSLKPYGAGVLFLLLLTPHIHWLFQHDFLPIAHLDDRITKAIPWYEPLAAAGTLLMPYAVLAAVLLLVIFPWKKKPDFTLVHREALSYSLWMTLVPAGIYLLLSLCRCSIILQWFSYLASFTGITMVALCPWKIDEKIFRRLFYLACVCFLVLFIGVTVDVNVKPRYRIHSDPALITAKAQEFFRRHSTKPIPAVYGDRWLAGVIQNYLPHRPPACVEEDPCDWKLVGPRMCKEGALLINCSPKELEKILKETGRAPVAMETLEYTYKAPWGKRIKRDSLTFGYFPSDAELKKGK